MEILQTHFNFVAYVVLMMIGMWAMISKNNLIKKLIGLAIFQSAIILFFISLAAKTGGADIPILYLKHGDTAAAAHGPAAGNPYQSAAANAADRHEAVNPDHYVNPLPHVLMLTAIVVGVSTFGVALSISQRIYKDYGTLEENEILEQTSRTPHG